MNLKHPLALLCGAFVFLTAADAHSDELRWQRIKIDSHFRSEGVAAADINHDGQTDVFAGDVWYEAPNWTMHPIREVGKYTAGIGYSKSFCNYAYDINADGWDDLILIGFPGDPFHWYENPQNKTGPWKAHLIWHSACIETPCFLDITGDGKPELLLGSQPESQLGFIPIPSPEKATEKWTFYP
ncbi:MAG: FG-GAP repeat domain-containing protein, partial [Planctomycetaceae bacterium]